MPVVKFIERLDLEQNISSMDKHQLDAYVQTLEKPGKTLFFRYIKIFLKKGLP
jgi:hypothetical protein